MMKHIFTSIATVIGPVLLILQFQTCSSNPAGARSTSSAVGTKTAYADSQANPDSNEAIESKVNSLAPSTPEKK